MKKGLNRFLFFVLILSSVPGFAQDSASFKWNVSSKKINANQYELVFSTVTDKGWQLYEPNQVLSEVATATLSFSDSAIQPVGPFKATGSIQEQPSRIFEGITE